VARLVEIRWHGRGGQGVKTAALLLAEAVAAAGKFIQGFPEYGPERMGAPVLAFNRISDEPITIHSHVKEPGVVVVMDPTLIGSVDVTEGLPEDGVIVINTSESPQKIRGKLGLCGRKVYTVDASQIALGTLGQAIPNTPMMGALIRATGLIGFDRFMDLVQGLLAEKFKSKPEVIKGNLQAIERAYQEVTGE